jgi:Fe-S-cluster containining protein
MADLEKIRARGVDPTLFVDAQKRVDKIKRNMLALHINEMAVALQDEPTRAGKFIWMRQMTDTLGKAVAGIVPCKDGCDHCCHMATNISIVEAQEIAEATGRAMVVPPDTDTIGGIEADRVRYNGVPCVFLVEHRCSIYAHRPHACRVHYSVDRDDVLCEIVPGVQTRVPSLNNQNFNMLFLLAHGDPREALMADIRDFFPPGDA